MVSDVSNWGHDMSTYLGCGLCDMIYSIFGRCTAQPHGSTSDNVDAKQNDPVKSAPSTN